MDIVIIILFGILIVSIILDDMNLKNTNKRINDLQDQINELKESEKS